MDMCRGGALMIGRDDYTFGGKSGRCFRSRLDNCTVRATRMTSPFNAKGGMAIATGAASNVAIARSCCLCGSCVLARFDVTSSRRLTSGCVTPMQDAARIDFLPTGGGETLFIPFSGSNFMHFNSCGFGSRRATRSSADCRMNKLCGSSAQRKLVLNSMRRAS